MQNDALTIDLLRTIIVEELGVNSERVNIYNQKFIIPPDDGLFIYLEYRGAPTIVSSRNSQELIANEYTEVQDINTVEDITIGLFSKNLDALRMKERVVMALYSIYSQQLQEAQGFKIFRGAKIVPLSLLEASALLYRFDIEVRVQAWYENIKAADYFDNHNVEVVVNDGDPDLEAEIVIPATDPTQYPQT